MIDLSIKYVVGAWGYGATGFISNTEASPQNCIVIGPSNDWTSTPYLSTSFRNLNIPSYCSNSPSNTDFSLPADPLNLVEITTIKETKLVSTAAYEQMPECIEPTTLDFGGSLTYTYELGDPALVIDLDQFTAANSVAAPCSDLEIDRFIVKEAGSLPGYATLSGQYLSIFTTNPSSIATHSLDITPRLPDGKEDSTITLTVDIIEPLPEVEEEVKINFYAPKMLGALKDQEVVVEESLNYILPPWIDEDGDMVNISASVSSSASLPPFISFAYPDFFFSPLTLDKGTYEVTVKLSDSGDPPRKSFYTFKLTVVDESENQNEGL